MDLEHLDHLVPEAQLRAALLLFLCTSAASHCYGWAVQVPRVVMTGWHCMVMRQLGFAAPVQHYNSTEGAAFCF